MFFPSSLVSLLKHKAPLHVSKFVSFVSFAPPICPKGPSSPQGCLS